MCGSLLDACLLLMLLAAPVAVSMYQAIFCAAGATVSSHVDASLRSRRYLPYIGMVTIIMNDYPLVKYALVALMGLFVLTSKEQ